MPHKRIGREREPGFDLRVIILLLLGLVGCSSYFENSGRGGGGDRASAPQVSNGSAAQARSGTTASRVGSAARADSDKSSEPVSGEQSAAAEALVASRKAQTAAEAAKIASEQAFEASKEASQAAARAGNSNSTMTTSAPVGASQNPSAAPTASSPIILSSETEEPSGRNQAQITALVQKISQSIAKIDRLKLTPEDARRRDLAEGLAQSAQKALLENDYLEANSLAVKASVILGPLISQTRQEDSLH